MTNSKIVLFTDVSHIRCGDLAWLAPDGEKLPVVGPPEPQIEVRAETGYVPHGVRISF